LAHLPSCSGSLRILFHKNSEVTRSQEQSGRFFVFCLSMASSWVEREEFHGTSRSCLEQCEPPFVL
jgi:hypothetical protein